MAGHRGCRGDCGWRRWAGFEVFDRSLHGHEPRLDLGHELAELGLEGLGLLEAELLLLGLAEHEFCAEGLHQHIQLGHGLAAELGDPRRALLHQDEAVAECRELAGLHQDGAAQLGGGGFRLGALHQDGVAKLGDGCLEVAAPLVHLGCAARNIGRVENVEGVLE